jgi:glycyl-tRNA synthetase beta chain
MLNSTRIVGERSYGHRFSSGPIEIADAAGYAEALRAVGVEPDSEERFKQIAAALDGLGDWTDPHGVLAEVMYLAESPVVLDCSFDERYLQLPSRVVETTIQHHIRAFPLGGNRFAFVANGGDPDTVRAGVENVVGGRLEDASFTFERDVKVGIDTLAERLGAITFFHGAGSFADKGVRLVKLVEALGGGEAALEAARLAKADQASELVREFPELEGHVGAEYARLAGYPEAVCAAIDEQYLPDAAEAPMPTTETGRVLSAADKIDTLNVSFGLGQRPTGSRDPYGLRRAAIGLGRLATEGNLSIPRELMDPVVGEFVEERSRGCSAHRSSTCAPRVGLPCATSAALPGSRKPRGAPGRTARPDPHCVHAREPARREGTGRSRGAGARSPRRGRGGQGRRRSRARRPGDRSRLDAGDFNAAVEAGAELGPLLDRFFEDVLVLADDRAVRANRLRLLLNVRDTLGRLGELSQIPG